jgi:hypothetical protein
VGQPLGHQAGVKLGAKAHQPMAGGAIEMVERAHAVDQGLADRPAGNGGRPMQELVQAASLG